VNFPVYIYDTYVEVDNYTKIHFFNTRILSNYVFLKGTEEVISLQIVFILTGIPECSPYLKGTNIYSTINMRGSSVHLYH
jgi:hypothetical protein